VFGLDESIAELGHGGTFILLIGVAALLGLRHATDPDHLTAVSILIASGRSDRLRHAATLGYSWGLGHATTLIALGLPIVLFKQFLPDAVQRAAEVAIGFVIMALAARLLLRWRQGYFHVHPHSHVTSRRAHTHAHAGLPDSADGHTHDHAGLGRSPRQAYMIGLLHGVGGSAGVGILLLAQIPDEVEGSVALAVFALFTALSMAIASTTFGYTLSRGPVARRFLAIAPVLGAISLVFGAWYALGAVDVVPYSF
jgi:ABC-type nickel/cobalt efflux system permease component RcnA